MPGEDVTAIATNAGGVWFVWQAVEADAPAVAALLDAVAAWLTAQGIRQWPPAFPPAWVLASITAGEVWLVGDPACPAAVVRLLTADPAIWPDTDAALYVHSLAVRREHAGQGLGPAILAWAASMARQRGCDWLRLDCAADNSRLITFYTEAGFAAAGIVQVDWFAAQRFEQRLGAPETSERKQSRERTRCTRPS